MLEKGDKFGKYTIVKRIGLDEQGNSKGANATVFVVGYKDKEYVLKIPNNPERLDNLFREIGNWAKVSLHPNILTYYETVTDSGKIGFISEYIQTGSLNDWLKNSANLSISQKLSMIDGILSGLEHLHENLILHRDLKPENIFVKHNVPLLADFGSAKDYDFAEMQYAYGFTYKYAPPELIGLYDDFGVVAKYQITEFDDLWSVAIIICEILTRQYPFARMSKILEAELSPFPKDTDQNIIGFIQKSLQKERPNRFQSVKEMRTALKNPQRFIAEKLEDAETIIDEDFDKTEDLKIEPTKDWREIEAEKQRQRESEERQRLEKERIDREAEAKRLQFEKEENLRQQKQAEEARRLQEIEAKRRQDEIAEIQRNLKSQTSDRSPSNIWKWAVGGAGGFVLVILGVFGISSLLKNNNSTVGNAPANKSSVSNTAAVNKPSVSSSNPLKNSIGMEFVKIPAGSFTMGSPKSEKDSQDDERPQHNVKISKDFYLGKYEVTQAQWQAVMGSNPSQFKGDNLPVETVSWDDVQEFIKKLNAKGEGTYRLPTEAEWEYSARGGKDEEVFGIGDRKNLSSEQANFDGNYPYGKSAKGKYLGKTVNVGSYQANDFGLYDMHGNAWEWCADVYGAYSSGDEIDPKGANSGSNRVLRGGSWFFNGRSLRSAIRIDNTSSFRYYGLGFRLIRVQ